ncbi:UV radiation resistance-associated gene protein [Marchantia polymorpha subsp. ruderalis]|uniref:UV radiation resistance-associated gene protein n=2 Tax=Marchantia polymorpha TaxID=3197 RepID=A0A176VJ25_MARPO|nr:hypothetical protein AXG93_2458s1070 [Marchantia polymorpha subsp. ruderalis]PTQ28121.1 hypothetical protein MARPO_0173s0024 [Marchantia polymorpha]BBN13832.1 hypothetical protein Mp_6g06790 [Marchantia polymorpha subsp. ruderalis]|eukprot:PTQ28121.1 hypothetical protein MARPO_0173s0024 [Marchantia polymorpha]
MGSQEPEGTSTSNSTLSDNEEEKEVKVVDWAKFHDVFYELGGVALKLNQLKAKKAALSEKLEALLQNCSKSIERVDCLESMKARFQKKKKVLESATATLLESSEQLDLTKKKLLPSVQTLHQSAKALAGAQSRLQEADRLLNGDGGHGRLTMLRKQLDARRRQMVGQVASLYPLATCTHHGPPSYNKQNHQAIANSQPSGPSNPPSAASEVKENLDYPCSGPASGEVPTNGVEETSIAIAGLQLVVPVKKQPGLFNEKNDYETSATALGYVAHVVYLMASYLDVPLRYPLRLGASRTYIRDYSPAAEPAIVESGAIAVPAGSSKIGVEFPLFSDNQELTRSAYAVFLLNKDLEQMLNRLGVDSVGPRHTLPNLNRLINAVTSGTLPLS